MYPFSSHDDFSDNNMSTIPFTIPKKRRALEGGSDLRDAFSYIDTVPNTTLYKEIENVVFKCLSESRLRSALCIQNVRKISNKILEQKFLNYKAKVKTNGYSDAESWAFLHVNSLQQEEDDVLRSGLQVNNTYFNELGRSEEGVCLSSHPDLVTPAKFYKETPVRIILFKVIKGRQKKVTLGAKHPASLDYNSYVAETNPGRVKRSDRYSRFRNTMVFLYEFDDNSFPVSIPTGIWPFAVFDLTLLNSWKTVPCFEHHISGYNGCEEVCKAVMSAGLFREKFELSSVSDSIYAVRPDLLYDFQVKRYCKWEHIVTHPVLKNLFEEQFWSQLLQTKEICVKKENERYYLAHYLMRSSGSTFEEKVNHMTKERKCAVGGMNTEYLLILITQGELASRMGFPYQSEEVLLHAIFLRQGQSIIGSNPLSYDLWASERSKNGMKLDENFFIDGNSDSYIAECRKYYSLQVKNSTENAERNHPSGSSTPVPTNGDGASGVRGILSTKKQESRRPAFGGNSRGQKRRIRWADNHGLPLQEYSVIERVGNSLSVNRLSKSELLLDTMRPSHEERMRASAEDSSPPSIENQNVPPTTSPAVVSESAPSVSNSIFQDAFSSLNTKTTLPTELTPFTPPGQSTRTEPVVTNFSKPPPCSPEQTTTGVPECVTEQRKSDDMDMDIDSDSEENRSFSPVHNAVLDPNDIDYDSRFNIAPVCEAEQKEDEPVEPEQVLQAPTKPVLEHDVIVLSDDEAEVSQSTKKGQDNGDTSTVDELLRNILGKKDKEKDTIPNGNVNNFLDILKPPVSREECKPAIAIPVTKRRSRFDIPPSEVQPPNLGQFSSPQRGFDVQSPAVSPMPSIIRPSESDKEEIKKTKLTFEIKKKPMSKFQPRVGEWSPPFVGNVSDIPLPGIDKASETKANVARNRLMSLLMTKKGDPETPMFSSSLNSAASLPASISSPVRTGPSSSPKPTNFNPPSAALRHQSNLFGTRNIPLQSDASSVFASHQNNSPNFNQKRLFANASPEPDFDPGISTPILLLSNSDTPESSKAQSLIREIPLGSVKRKQKKPVRLSDPCEEEEGEIVSDEEEQSKSTKLIPEAGSIRTSPNTRHVPEMRGSSFTPVPVEPRSQQRFHSVNSSKPADWAYIIVPDVLSFEPHCLNPVDFRAFCERMMSINSSKIRDFLKSFIKLHRHCLKHVENKRLTASDEQTRKIFESYYQTLTEFERKGLIHIMPEHECDEKNGRTQNDITHCLKLALYNYRRKHVETKLVYMSNQHSTSALGQALSKTAVPIITPQALFSGFPHIFNNTYM
ncbi:unnamed protein product [Auanema sp. JU1783]|nr:unnamed protein product [Auanema sp. JU1783]